MTPLRAALQAFFADRLPGSGARVRTRSPPTATLPASARVPARATGKRLRSWGRRPRRREDRRVPRASETRTRQQRPHPQRPADRDPLVLPLRGPERPEQAELIARVLDIPEKRFDTTLISYLTEPEIDALLAAPDRSTWTGRRDHALLLLAVQTGLAPPNSQACAAKTSSSKPAPGSDAKARAEKRGAPAHPPDQTSAAHLVREQGGNPTSPLFPSRSGRHLTRGAIWRRLSTTPSPPAAMPLDHDQEHHPARAASHRRDATPARPNPIDTATIAFGSATKRSTRPTSTSTPTWNSNDARSTAPRPRRPNQAATAHQTRSSRSLRASEPPELC